MAIDPEAFDAFDAKAATPDTSVPEGAVLFGADSQSASSPSVYPLSDLADVINAANSVAAPSPDSSANTAAIQAALDAVPDGGGQVRIDKPGTYLLSAAGANPYYEGHKCCLEIKKD